MADRGSKKRAKGAGANAARIAQATRGTPAPEKTRGGPRLGTQRWLRPYGLALLAAAILTLAFPPAEISWLAYPALVPLLVMAVRTPSGRSVFLAGYLGGLAFFAVNLHWIWPVTAAGYFALIPYMALYWAVFAWVVRRVNHTLNVPLTLLAPLVWVPLELVRAWLLTGMPWAFVSHTQHASLVLIQAADTLGAYGTTFLVLMTAGFLADLLVRPIVVPSATAADGGAAGAETRRADADTTRHTDTDTTRRATHISGALILMAALLAAAWAGTVGYGLWRLGQDGRRPGPTVVSVQTCVPQDVKNIVKTEQMQTADDIRREIDRIRRLERDMLDTQLRLTDEAVAAAKAEGLAPDLVVWPETMVPGIMNTGFLEYSGEKLSDYPELARLRARSQGFWKDIRAESEKVGAPILFGGHSTDLEPGLGGRMTFTNSRNTAFLMAPTTRPFGIEHVYFKAHLVPFGEYVPFKYSWPAFYQWLRSFTPYDYDYSLSPGDHDQAPFVLKHAGGEARFQVPICYEDAMPYRVREMVRPADDSGRKAVDFLVNISNDGWFVTRPWGRNLPDWLRPAWDAGVGVLRVFSPLQNDVELDQHLNLCVFRAVENRVPIVRAVNTGISAIINSDGRVETCVSQDGARRNITGHIQGRLAFDDRVALYTLIGDTFALACGAVAVILLAAAVVVARRKRPEPE